MFPINPLPDSIALTLLTSLLLPHLATATPPTFPVAISFAANNTCSGLYLTNAGTASPTERDSFWFTYTPSAGQFFCYSGSNCNAPYGTCPEQLISAFVPLTETCGSGDPITKNFTGADFDANTPLTWTNPAFTAPGNKARFYLTSEGAVVFNAADGTSKGEEVYLVNAVYGVCGSANTNTTAVSSANITATSNSSVPIAPSSPSIPMWVSGATGNFGLVSGGGWIAMAVMGVVGYWMG